MKKSDFLHETGEHRQFSATHSVHVSYPITTSLAPSFWNFLVDINISFTRSILNSYFLENVLVDIAISFVQTFGIVQSRRRSGGGCWKWGEWVCGWWYCKNKHKVRWLDSNRIFHLLFFILMSCVIFILFN